MVAYTKTSGAVVDALGRNQFADRNDALGQQGTYLVADDRNQDRNTLVSPVVASGQNPDADNDDQLTIAIQVLGAIPLWSQSVADAIKGYPLGAVVRDATPKYWCSTADKNLTTPGDDGSEWVDFLSDEATQTWANGQFLQLANAAVQAVTGPVTFSGITTVPTPTDYTKKQAIGASDADGRYARLVGGNSLSGLQGIKGSLSVGTSAGWSGGTAPGTSRWSSGHLLFGAPDGTDSVFQGGFQITDTIGDSSANNSNYPGINMLGFNYAGTRFDWFFSWNGNIQTPKGVVAFQSQLPQTTHSGNAGDAGSYTITVYTDPSTPSGKRYRISGQTAAFTAESCQTISLPLTLNGILPGAWGATTFWNVNTSVTANDQFAQIIGAPTVSSITVNMAVTTYGATTWPCYATWWVEGY